MRDFDAPDARGKAQSHDLSEELQCERLRHKIEHLEQHLTARNEDLHREEQTCEELRDERDAQNSERVEERRSQGSGGKRITHFDDPAAIYAFRQAEDFDRQISEFIEEKEEWHRMFTQMEQKCRSLEHRVEADTRLSDGFYDDDYQSAAFRPHHPTTSRRASDRGTRRAADEELRIELDEQQNAKQELSCQVARLEEERSLYFSEMHNYEQLCADQQASSQVKEAELFQLRQEVQYLVRDNQELNVEIAAKRFVQTPDTRRFGGFHEALSLAADMKTGVEVETPTSPFFGPGASIGGANEAQHAKPGAASLQDALGEAAAARAELREFQERFEAEASQARRAQLSEQEAQASMARKQALFQRTRAADQQETDQLRAELRCVEEKGERLDGGTAGSSRKIRELQRQLQTETKARQFIEEELLRTLVGIRHMDTELRPPSSP